MGYVIIASIFVMYTSACQGQGNIIISPKQDNLCIQNSSPPLGCTCKNWQYLTTQHHKFLHGTPMGRNCCMSPSLGSIRGLNKYGSLGYCFCNEGSWQRCVPDDRHTVNDPTTSTPMVITSTPEKHEVNEHDFRLTAHDPMLRSGRGVMLSAVAPVLTSFMGSLMTPLISSVGDRVGFKGLINPKGVRKSNILTKFFDRALSSTKIANTEYADTVKGMLIKGKYGQAIDKLQYKDQILPMSSLIEYPRANTTLKRMQNVDDILKTRLLTLSEVQMSFVSTILEQFRNMVSSEHKLVIGDISEVNSTLDSLLNHMLKHAQQSNPSIEYALLVAILFLACLHLVALFYLKHAICNFFMDQKLNSEFWNMRKTAKLVHAQHQNTIQVQDKVLPM